MTELMNDALVLKVGTSTLVHRAENGTDQLDIASFERIGRQVDELVESGCGVVLVSSGARKRLPNVGWDGVVDAWDIAIGADTRDFLLTERELDTYHGCRDVISIARMGGVAIVNANDPILAEASPYRNNDIVAATIAEKIGWALFGKGNVQLGILSDISGVLADIDDPNSIIHVIDDLDAHQHLAGGTGIEGATGGMRTKFEAARIAMKCGIRTWVAHGRTDDVVHHALPSLVTDKKMPQILRHLSWSRTSPPFYERSCQSVLHKLKCIT
jgi:glutamate 5-kinase